MSARKEISLGGSFFMIMYRDGLKDGLICQGPMKHRYWIALNTSYHFRNVSFQKLHWLMHLQCLGAGIFQLHPSGDYYILMPAKNKYTKSAGAAVNIHPMMLSSFPIECTHINGIGTVLQL